MVHRINLKRQIRKIDEMYKRGDITYGEWSEMVGDLKRTGIGEI
jgi:hypothetical protein